MTSGEVVFTREAVKALYLASRTCGRNYPGFKGEIEKEKIILNELFRPFFATRPTLWVTFCKYLKKNSLGKIPKMAVVRFYSLFHLDFVDLFAPHFEKMAKEELAFLGQQGFSFSEENNDEYLFACLGRVGKILQCTNGLAKVDCGLDGKHSVVMNLVVPFEEKISYLAFHFGNAYAILTESEYRQIQKEQIALGRRLYLRGHIDYRNWCGGDLTEYTLKLLDLQRPAA